MRGHQNYKDVRHQPIIYRAHLHCFCEAIYYITQRVIIGINTRSRKVASGSRTGLFRVVSPRVLLSVAEKRPVALVGVVGKRR